MAREAEFVCELSAAMVSEILQKVGVLLGE